MKELTWAVKGVGAQGDGSVQMLARGREEQEKLVELLNEMGEKISSDYLASWPSLELSRRCRLARGQKNASSPSVVELVYSSVFAAF